MLIGAALGAALRAGASDGNELNAIGAIQQSMGGAGAASPQDATWSLLNPAGLTQLDRRLDASFEMIFIHIESHPRGNPLASNPFAGNMEMDAEIPVPSMGVVLPLKTGVLGIGAFGMQGNAADFSQPRTTLSLLKHGDRRSSYQVARIPIAYAYEFDNGWSLGAAVVPVTTRFNTDSITLKLRPTIGDAMWRYGQGIGFEAGVLKKWDKFSLGASYSSRVWMQDYADYETDLVKNNLDLPQKLQVGLSWRPVKRFELVADYKWTAWSETKLFGERTIDGGLGWRNQHVYKLGGIVNINEQWTARAGISYGRSPIREQYVFANAISPALANWHFAAGVSYRMNERHEFHLAATHVPSESMTESGTGDIFSRLARGTRTSYAENSVTLQYTFRF